MSGTILKHRNNLNVVDFSAALPFPAHNQPIAVESNQLEHRSAGGKLWTVKVGPTIYRITRKFEALKEHEVQLLFYFLEAVGFASSRIAYSYVDGVSAVYNEIPCRIIEAPREAMVHLNNRDVTLVFEQYLHPDSVTDSTALDIDNAIADEGDGTVIADEGDGTIIADQGV